MFWCTLQSLLTASLSNVPITMVANSQLVPSGTDGELVVKYPSACVWNRNTPKVTLMVPTSATFTLLTAETTAPAP